MAPQLTGTRIVRFRAENFKRLKAVEITPDGNIIEVRGRNAQGKTSVLDAIWHALSYSAAKKGNSKPIREGADTATVRLEFEDFIVTRTWTADDKSHLSLESLDGLKYPTPQKLLDAVVGSLSFDPLAFSNAASKEQLKMLLDVVELPFNPEQLEAKRKEIFEHRTAVNRRVSELEAQVAGMDVPSTDLPEQEIPAAEVLEKLQQAQQSNGQRATWERRVAEARQLVVDLEARLVEARAILDTNEGHLKDQPALVDLSVFQQQLADLEATNAAIRVGKQRRDLVVQRDDFKAQAISLTEQLDAMAEAKASAMRNAALPIDGLGFDEDGLTFNGVPFSQASGAEQLRICIAMGMALNPNLRVMRISDASLLDTASKELVQQMADEHDFQIWLEVVSEDGSVGVLIDDGEVVTA